MSNSTSFAVGMDISDREMSSCVLNESGVVHHERTVSLDRPVLQLYLSSLKEHNPIFALETGTHANWIYDLLLSLGFTRVIVADARSLKMIFKSNNKTDRQDARKLARFAQSCPELLHSVKPRSERSRQDRRLLSARHVCVKARTKFVSYVRGIVKSTGVRLASCDADRFPDFADSLPESLSPILVPVLDAIRQVTTSIQQLDELIERRCEGDAVIARLTQIKSVGPITALAFTATIENPVRFSKNRNVASFLGLRPRIDESGEMNKQLGITKAGDDYTRQLLVMSAQGLMRRNSQATDLKHWGLSIAQTGGKRGKRRAAVAVARKLAVLLLTLWKTGEDYVPLRSPSTKNVRKTRTTSLTNIKKAA